VGIIAVDEVTEAYLKDRERANGSLRAEPKIYHSDPDANYIKHLVIDLDSLSPIVAYPFLPSNGKAIDEAVKDEIEIDQVIIGSCTNGRIEDLRTSIWIIRSRAERLHRKTHDMIVNYPLPLKDTFY